MAHIVLLGDSIFDNGAYVEAGVATIDELRSRLPQGWDATLLAVDGSVTADVFAQLGRIPKSATHLVLSSGGNDALAQQSLLYAPVEVAGQAFLMLGTAARSFEDDYRKLLRAALDTRCATIVCTIYNGNFPDPREQLVMSTALSPFNDAIIRTAWEAEVPIIDLRAVCDEPKHYANEIEPSTEGSARIAEEIVRLVAGEGRASA